MQTDKAHWFLVERANVADKSRVRLLKDYRRTLRKEKDLGHARRLLRFKTALAAAQVPAMTLEAFRKNYNVVFHEETLSYTIEQRQPPSAEYLEMRALAGET